MMVSLSRHDSSVPRERTTRPRHAVLLTLSVDGNCSFWSYLHTGTFPRLISFVSHLGKHRGCVGYSSHSGTYPPPVTPLILVLSFHCKFRNSFLLTFMYWMGGVHLSSFHRGAK